MSTEPAAATGAKAGSALRAAMTPTVSLLLALLLMSQTTQYMVMPFLALYFRQALHLSVPLTGLLIGLPFVSAVVFGLPGGALADRIGLLRSFVGAQVVSALAIGALALVHGVVPMALLLLVGGAIRPVASSTLPGMANRLAQPEERGVVQNALYWVQNLGVVIGLLLSAELLRGGLSATPFVVLGVVSLAGATLAVVVLGPRVGALAGKAPAAPTGVRTLAATLLNDRALLLGALTSAFVILVESQVSSTLPLALAAHVADAGRLFGPLLAIDAVCVLALTPLAMHYLGSRRAVPVFAVGALLSAAGLALGGSIGTPTAWVAAMVVYSVGEVLWVVKLNDLIAGLPGAANAGLYFAVLTTAQYAGMFVGTTGGPLVLHSVGPDVIFPGMLVVAGAAGLSFRAAAAALRRRAEAAAAQAVAVAALPDRAPEPSPVDAAEPGPAPNLVPSAAAFHAPSPVPDPATFDIPAPAERVAFLAELGPDEWQRLLAYTERVVVAAGETVVAQQSVERALYLVRKGRLAVVVGPAEHERNLTLIPPGSVFGEQSFVDGQPRSATIRALDKAEVHRLSWEAYTMLSDEEPVLSRAVMASVARILSERLRLTTALVGRRAG